MVVLYEILGVFAVFERDLLACKWVSSRGAHTRWRGKGSCSLVDTPIPHLVSAAFPKLGFAKGLHKPYQWAAPSHSEGSLLPVPSPKDGEQLINY